MKAPYFITTCILFIGKTFYANNSGNDLQVIRTLDTYIGLINFLNEDGAKEILELYSEQYSGNTTYVNLSGAIVKKTYTKEDIKNQLTDIVEDGNYSLKFSKNNILYSAQKKSAGTIAVLLDFESFIDNKTAEKGTILMNMVIVNQKGKWKIIQNNMVRVSETKEIGDCICHIFEKGTTQFVTELYYPAGVKYDHKFEAFRISNEGKDRIIKSGDNRFIWQDNDKVFLNQKELGFASKPKKFIELIINELNSKTCINTIFR